jgi:hypothetical protein
VTADEKIEIGKLIGTVGAQNDRLKKIEDALLGLDAKLDELSAHGTAEARQLAIELAAYKATEAKWKTEIIQPLIDGVRSYQRFRLAISLAVTIIVGICVVAAWVLDRAHVLHDLF